MAPTYQTFADEESLISQPPKTTSTRKAAGLGAVAVLVAVLGVSTVSHVNPMFDIVSAASGGIDFDRSVKTLAPGYDFNLSPRPWVHGDGHHAAAEGLGRQRDLGDPSSRSK